MKDWCTKPDKPCIIKKTGDYTFRCNYCVRLILPTTDEATEELERIAYNDPTSRRST